MTDLITIDLDAERMTVERLRQAWIVELKKKSEAVATANRTKGNPGADYWQAEDKARSLYNAAADFVAALERARK